MFPYLMNLESPVGVWVRVDTLLSCLKTADESITSRQ